jgi:hypothetical protein
MASKSKQARLVKQRNLAKDFMYWAIAIFFIKLIIIGNVQGGAWLGADGENYLKGSDALTRDGFFSTEPFLSYWPSGYPLFIYVLEFFAFGWHLYALTIIQSAVFSYAVYFLAKNLLKTKLVKFTYVIFLMILLNPTLSLTSLAIGYESFVASGLLLIIALIIKSVGLSKKSLFTQELFMGSLISCAISIFQPRFLLATFITFAVWTLMLNGKKLFVVPLILSLLIVSIAPAILIFRNYHAMGFTAISTNLGGTMNLGAGDKASGAYTFKDSGVPCTEISGNAADKDRHLVGCVIDWYLSNPVKATELAFNKSKFFWSPWYGPEANGSMARNPWLFINPLKDIAESTPDGSKLVFGGMGKIISYGWIASQVALLFYGFIVFIRFGRFEKILGNLILAQVLISWLISIGTLGDHRQRLPTMGMSLILQAVALRKIIKSDGPKVASPSSFR